VKSVTSEKILSYTASNFKPKSQRDDKKVSTTDFSSTGVIPKINLKTNKLFVSENLEGTESQPAIEKQHEKMNKTNYRSQSRGRPSISLSKTSKKNMFANEDLIGTESLPQINNREKEEREKEEKGLY